MSVFTNPASASKEQAEAYVDALLDLVGDRDPYDILRGTPDALGRAVGGMTERDLSTPEAPGKWSVRHVLRHLADSELVWGWRLRMVLAQDRPTITGYDQDAWATRLAYQDADAGETLDEFGAVRRGNLGLLDRISPEDMRRVGIHVERGEESVEGMIPLYAGHDLLHLRQIARVRRTVEGVPADGPGSEREGDAARS